MSGLLLFGGMMAGLESPLYTAVATIQQGQGFKYLAKLYYKDENEYQRIIDANTPELKFAAKGKSILMSDRWKDAEESGERLPVLYVGDVLLIPVMPPVPEDTPDNAANKGGQSTGGGQSSSGGKIFRKTYNGWFGVKTQFPNPKVEIFTSGNSGKANLTYEALAKDSILSELLGYTFSEGVDDLEGSFSITVENEKIDDKTTYDLIPLRSVVKIYEADKEKAAFIGIIKQRRIKSSMTSQGPKRTIMFSGKSIVSAISEYAVTTDLRISFVDPGMKSKQLTENLSRNELTIKGFMKKTWEEFLKQGKDNEVSSTEIEKLIKAYIGSIDKFVSGDNDRTLHYNITGAFYSEGNNNIDQLWRNVLPQPVYEIYAYCDRDTGKPMIKAREVPFGFPGTKNQDWHNLDIYEIDPLDLIDYDVSQSDDEVYNVFMSYLIGSAMEQTFYLAVRSGKINILEKDETKLAIYGYRPLQISFRGYDRQGAEKDSSNLDSFFKKLDQKAKYWFGRLDEMYNGTITLITDFKLDDNAEDRNPRVGCRASFLGGEFYITKADHRWTYGGTPTITLSISRGMKYKEGYQVSGEGGVLTDVGKLFEKLE
jgi:hypothetical protein